MSSPVCLNCRKPLAPLVKLDGTVVLVHAVPNPMCPGPEAAY